MSDKIFIAQESTSQEIKSAVNSIYNVLNDNKPKRYGYRVNLKDSNPATRVEYLFDAVGMTPVTHNNDGTLNFGAAGAGTAWNELWFVANNYACMLNSAGAEDYKLSPNNYGYKIDGTSVSDYNSLDYNGNVMSAIPLCWVKRYTEGGYQYCIICETQYDESYEALAHTDANGSIKQYAYMACFEGYNHEGKLRSIAGNIPSTEGDGNSNTAANQYSWAAAVGTDFTVTPWSLWTLISDLLVLMAKNTNSQAIYGQGYCTGGSSRANLRASGELYNKGQFWGDTSVGSQFMKVFHIENFYGHVWKRAAGLFAKNYTYYAQMNQSNGAYSTTLDVTKCDAIGYAGVYVGPSAGHGWIKQFNTGRYGCLPYVTPSTASASDSTYECDYHWWGDANEHLALLGGSCCDGSEVGCRYVSLITTAGRVYWRLGCSLAKV